MHGTPSARTRRKAPASERAGRAGIATLAHHAAAARRRIGPRRLNGLGVVNGNQHDFQPIRFREPLGCDIGCTGFHRRFHPAFSGSAFAGIPIPTALSLVKRLKRIALDRSFRQGVSRAPPIETVQTAIAHLHIVKRRSRAHWTFFHFASFLALPPPTRSYRPARTNRRKDHVAARSSQAPPDTPSSDSGRRRARIAAPCPNDRRRRCRANRPSRRYALCDRVRVAAPPQKSACRASLSPAPPSWPQPAQAKP